MGSTYSKPSCAAFSTAHSNDLSLCLTYSRLTPILMLLMRVFSGVVCFVIFHTKRIVFTERLDIPGEIKGESWHSKADCQPWEGKQCAHFHCFHSLVMCDRSKGVNLASGTTCCFLF